MNIHEQQLMAVAKALETWIFQPSEPASRAFPEEISKIVKDASIQIFESDGASFYTRTDFEHHDGTFAPGFWWSYENQYCTAKYFSADADICGGPYDSKEAAEQAAFITEKLYLYN